MYDVTAIGEALIDFIPAQRDCALKEVESFTRVCGGAPTNVAAVVAKLQGNARLLTQVGNDAFRRLYCRYHSSLRCQNRRRLPDRCCQYCPRFCFLKSRWQPGFFLLSETQCRLALTAGTDSADLAGRNRYPALLLGFSGRIPNERNPQSRFKTGKRKTMPSSVLTRIYRLPLWSSAGKLVRKPFGEFLPDADLVKLSDVECFSSSTGQHSILDAADWLFEQGCKMVLYSMGKKVR